MENFKQLQRVMSNVYGDFMGEKKLSVKKKITDIPIMLSDSGEIVCFPDREDEPTAGVIGAKGKGKSFFEHTLLDRGYHYGNKDCFVGNDIMSETFPWSSPNRGDWEKLSFLGEKPAPLPMAYFLPKVKRSVTPKQAHINLALPIEEILDNPSKFMEMDKSAPYFRGIAEDMKRMSIEDMCNYIDENIDKRYTTTKIKLKTLLRDLQRENIIDSCSNKNVSTIKVVDAITGETEEYNALSACMRAGLIPSILTGDLLTKHYAGDFLRYFYENIYDNQREDSYFRKRRVWGLLDELTSVCSTENKSKASEAITQMVARGRPVRVGIIYGTQNYTKVPPIIRTNTLYLFTLGYKNKNEISAISSDFDLSKSDADAIRKLDTFDVMAMTTEYFVCYDNEGNRRETDPDEVIIGKSLPTLSMHKKPTN